MGEANSAANIKDGPETEDLSPSSAAVGTVRYHCLDLWAVSPETFALPANERNRAIRSLVQSRDGPADDDSLCRAGSPLSLSDEVLTVASLLLFLGGPLISVACVVPAFVLGSWTTRLSLIVVTMILSLHPMPSRNGPVARWFLTCRLTRSLYRYFTYRLVWTGDAAELARDATPWIGAGPPHGVLPLANILSIPAINTAMGVDFVGAPASVVFRTPFLRYLTIYPSVHVDRRTVARSTGGGTCVGLVPDGIAGIFRQDPHREVVAMLHRKGLARLALRTGTNILPAYSFGNTSTFSSWWDGRGILEGISRKAQASLFLYWGRWGLPVPRRVPITMAFGPPIVVDRVGKEGVEPTTEQVDELHSRILQEIRKCFEEHKASVGWKDKELVFE